VKHTPFSLMLIAVLAFSINPIIAKIISDEVSFIGTLLVRFLFVVLFLPLIVVLIKENTLSFFFKISKRRLLHLFILAIFLAGNMALFYLSFDYIPINRALFIFFTYPIITSIMAHIFINEPITKQDLISILISLVGVIIIFWKTSLTGGTLIGDIMVIISVLMWSGYIVLNRYTALREVYYKQTFWLFAFSFILLLPVFFFVDSFSTFAAASTKTIFLLILVGSFSTLLPYTILNYASKHMKTSVIGFFILLSTVLTIFLSFAFLDEEPSANVIIGGILIIFAAITSIYSFDKLFSFKKYVRLKFIHEGWSSAVRILLRR